MASFRDIANRIHHVLTQLGCDPLRFLRAVKGFGPFWRDYRTFRTKLGLREKTAWPIRLFPCLTDRKDPGGVARGQYFHQDLLVAGMVHAKSPRRHLDIGSRIDGLVAHIAAFRQVDVCDIRPSDSTVPNIRFRQVDLTGNLDDIEDRWDSISCLHALEHFGLGRYGDPVDPDGHVKGLRNIHKLLEPGGTLYLSVPIGPQRVEFNGHRVFNVAGLLGIIGPLFAVRSFSYVDDRGDLHRDVPLTEEGAGTSFGCTYGCGILELVRLEGAPGGA